MDQDTLWQQVQTLPREAQQQLLDFLTFLQAKYVAKPHVPHGMDNLTTDPFVGIWQSRTDRQESTPWVRMMRKREWHDDSS
jgi:response regulator of citrate/malate metabolism